jgi:transposase
VTRFRLSERVPRHNLYRGWPSWSTGTFLYDETKALYSRTGQPSLDPVVFFKLVLVGRLENLVSDRRLVEHCALRWISSGFWATRWTRNCPGTRP